MVGRMLSTALLVIGVFLLVAGGAGYMEALNDRVQGTGSQVALLAVGGILTLAGRYLRQRRARASTARRSTP